MAIGRALARVIAAGLLAAAGCGAPEEPRGLLLVTIDTCRADRIGCYGGGPAETPVLDGLAERGTVFLQATAPAPLTLPSHLSVLTGLYPDRHGVRDNGAGRLPEEAVTIAEVLAERGWRTGAFVAAVPVESRYGTGQGFGRYDDDFVRGDVSGDLLTRLHTDQRTADQVVAAAAPWLREAAAARDPFFAWVHFFDPHSPYAPPERWAERFPAAPYEGEIAYVDEQIGLLLEALGDAAPRTIVAVTADHGESLGEHGEATHGFLLYDSALRVPWILAGPGVETGRREAAPVSLVDVAPTLLDAVGAEAPRGLDGVSVLRGGAPEAVYAEALFGRLNFGWSAARSIREGRWKFVESEVPELFDLETDPGETRSVLDDHPEVAARLRARLHAHHARGGALAAGEVTLDEETRARLEGLGYVGTGGDAIAGEDSLWVFDAGDPRRMVTVFDDLQPLPTLILGGPEAAADSLVASLLERAPGNAAILKRVAQLWARARNWPRAETAARELLAVDPDDAEMRHALAAARLRQGDVPGARAAYREATARDPGDARAWVGRGVLAAVEGDCRAAAEALDRGSALPLDDAQLLSDVAAAWTDCGEDDRALAAYDRALSVDGAFSPAWNGKALLLSHAGRREAAAEVLRDALQVLPEDVETLNNLAWILADAGLDPAAALKHARRAAGLAPQDAVVLDTLGWAAIRAGRPAEAVEPLRRALDATRDAEVKAHLGIALAESGQEEEGRALVRAAVRERPALAEIPEVQKWR